MVVIDVTDTYFKVFIGEIAAAKIERRGTSLNLLIEYDDAIFRARRVRVLSRVADISERERRIDCLLMDDTGQVIVRAWDEKRDLLEGLRVNDLVDVFAYPREFREELYLVPIIVVRVDEETLRARREEIKDIRKHLIKIESYKGGEEKE